MFKSILFVDIWIKLTNHELNLPNENYLVISKVNFVRVTHFLFGLKVIKI